MAFLKLWGVLEVLTDTTVGGPYDETIKRTCFLYEDSAFNQGLMKVLRRYRNRSVHLGMNSIRRETVVILHRYVVRNLLFALSRSREFTSLTELGHFLSLPASPTDLLRKAELFKMATIFRRIKI